MVHHHESLVNRLDCCVPIPFLPGLDHWPILFYFYHLTSYAARLCTFVPIPKPTQMCQYQVRWPGMRALQPQRDWLHFHNNRLLLFMTGFFLWHIRTFLVLSRSCVGWAVQHSVVIMYVLFHQIGAHSLLQSKVKTNSCQKMCLACNRSSSLQLYKITVKYEHKT